ncbi:MAG: calcium-binding protein, partial [Spirochaetales bacterium]|nr:calcium-binding protein [Spirochaetales bacterium]
MAKTKEDKSREDRITDEIVVDAYDTEERIMGWQTYLEDTLQFPFQARCIKEIQISPLKQGEKITALKMADSDQYRNNMFVIIEWEDRQLGIPLEQILPIDADADALEAVKDWHYWVARGY